MTAGLSPAGTQNLHRTEHYSLSSRIFNRFTNYSPENRITKALFSTYRQVFEISNTLPSSWPSLQPELFYFVSQFLTPDQLGCSIRVCRTWAAAFDQNANWSWQAQRLGENRFPAIGASLGQQFEPKILQLISGYDGDKQVFSELCSAMIFGRQALIKYMGDPGKAPPFPRYTYEIFHQPCLYQPEKIKRQTNILMLVPAKVKINDRAIPLTFTLKGAVELIDSYYNGKLSEHKIIRDSFGRSIKKSHWIHMTNRTLFLEKGIKFMRLTD